MPWSWDDVELPYEREPIAGEIQGNRRRVWVFAQPRGSRGTLKQRVSTESYKVDVRMRLDYDTALALNAKYESDVAVLHQNPRPPYSSGGIMMVITEFDMIWNPSVPGIGEVGEWDCHLVCLEDDGTIL